MKTTLFNLHEVKVKGGSVLIEFYAGDIFDVQSDILLLSAFKGGYSPVKGTTWGDLHEHTDIRFSKSQSNTCSIISENVVRFDIPENDHFDKLYALELRDPNINKSFTPATLISRYNELGELLEHQTSREDESISMPLLGTGNQGLSLDESITEMLKVFNKLKNTKLKVIRVFAKDFLSIGTLNKKINELLNRTQVNQSPLLQSAINEARMVLDVPLISALTRKTIENILSLAESDHSALFAFGLRGRIFAEEVCNEFLKMYNIDLEPSMLNARISELSRSLRKERPTVECHLRLLQFYGNQVTHAGNEALNHQDAAAIIISIIRVLDFYEYKLSFPTLKARIIVKKVTVKKEKLMHIDMEEVG